jgi:Domain of Unknown Function (DUF1206)
MARTATTNPVERVGRQAGQAVEDVARSPWVEWLARFGYAARGVVYGLIGILALKTAFGTGGATTDTHGAVQAIAQQSRFLLILVAIGLFGYALWRFVQAVVDPEHKGTDPKGLAQRGAMLASGISYGFLAVAAARIAGGSQSAAQGADGGTQGMTANLMAQPFGRWLVALAGIAMIVSGLYQLSSGWKEKFRRHLRLDEMPAALQHRVVQTGKLGLISRGFVFLMIGMFLIVAAWQADPTEARGLGGALATLAQQPYGPWLLGLVALGLLAFGVYSLVESRYRRIVLNPGQAPARP